MNKYSFFKKLTHYLTIASYLMMVLAPSLIVSSAHAVSNFESEVREETLYTRGTVTAEDVQGFMAHSGTWQHTGEIELKAPLELRGSVIFNGVTVTGRKAKIINNGILRFLSGINVFPVFLNHGTVSLEGNWMLGLAQKKGVAFADLAHAPAYPFKAYTSKSWTRFKTEVFDSDSPNPFSVSGNLVYTIPYTPIPLTIAGEAFFPALPKYALRELSDLRNVTAPKVTFATSETLISQKYKLRQIAELLLISTDDLTFTTPDALFTALHVYAPTLLFQGARVTASGLLEADSLLGTHLDHTRLKSDGLKVSSAGCVTDQDSQLTSTAAAALTSQGNMSLTGTEIIAEKDVAVKTVAQGDLHLDQVSLTSKKAAVAVGAAGNITNTASTVGADTDIDMTADGSIVEVPIASSTGVTAKAKSMAGDKLTIAAQGTYVGVTTDHTAGKSIEISGAKGVALAGVTTTKVSTTSESQKTAVGLKSSQEIVVTQSHHPVQLTAPEVSITSSGGNVTVEAPRFKTQKLTISAPQGALLDKLVELAERRAGQSYEPGYFINKFRTYDSRIPSFVGTNLADNCKVIIDVLRAELDETTGTSSPFAEALLYLQDLKKHQKTGRSEISEDIKRSLGPASIAIIAIATAIATGGVSASATGAVATSSGGMTIAAGAKLAALVGAKGMTASAITMGTSAALQTMLVQSATIAIDKSLGTDTDFSTAAVGRSFVAGAITGALISQLDVSKTDLSLADRAFYTSIQGLSKTSTGLIFGDGWEKAGKDGLSAATDAAIHHGIRVFTPNSVTGDVAASGMEAGMDTVRGKDVVEIASTFANGIISALQKERESAAVEDEPEVVKPPAPAPEEDRVNEDSDCTSQTSKAPQKKDAPLTEELPESSDIKLPFIISEKDQTYSFKDRESLEEFLIIITGDSEFNKIISDAENHKIDEFAKHPMFHFMMEQKFPFVRHTSEKYWDLLLEELPGNIFTAQELNQKFVEIAQEVLEFELNKNTDNSVEFYIAVEQSEKLKALEALFKPFGTLATESPQEQIPDFKPAQNEALNNEGPRIILPVGAGDIQTPEIWVPDTEIGTPGLVGVDGNPLKNLLALNLALSQALFPTAPYFIKGAAQSVAEIIRHPIDTLLMPIWDLGSNTVVLALGTEDLLMCSIRSAVGAPCMFDTSQSKAYQNSKDFFVDRTRGLLTAGKHFYQGNSNERATMLGSGIVRWSAPVGLLKSLTYLGKGVGKAGRFVSEEYAYYDSVQEIPYSAGKKVIFSLEENQVFHRVYSRHPAGEFLTKGMPKTRQFSSHSLALSRQNKAFFTQEVHVPKGTTLERSRACSNFGKCGGAVQYRLLEKIPNSSFKRGTPLQNSYDWIFEPFPSFSKGSPKFPSKMRGEINPKIYKGKIIKTAKIRTQLKREGWVIPKKAATDHEKWRKKGHTTIIIRKGTKDQKPGAVKEIAEKAGWIPIENELKYAITGQKNYVKKE